MSDHFVAAGGSSSSLGVASGVTNIPQNIAQTAIEAAGSLLQTAGATAPGAAGDAVR